RMEQKPAIASGVITASVPPAIMASASPFWIRRKASPTAWSPVVHAVAGDVLGPRARQRIETCPAAMLTISAGMKNGDTRSGPRSTRTLLIVSMTGSPPIPEPMTTPTRSALPSSMTRPESSMANCAAQAVVDECVALLDFLLVEVVERIEPLDLSGDAGRVAGRVEARDGADPALPREQGLPVP